VNRQEVGRLGEKLARNFLKKKGYRIRETGYRCSRGEMDIVATKKGCLVFAEVRTRSSPDFGTPEESITEAKKGRLVATALTYLSTHKGLPEQWRIDVVAVELDEKGKASRIELIENAVEGESRRIS